MPVPVIMPKLEMTQETATVIEWLADEGQQVAQGDPILTVETDKVTIEIEAPASGTLAGLLAASGDVVPVTQVIAHILQPGEALPQPVVRPSDEPKSPLAFSGPQPPVPASGGTADGVRATPVARRLAREHGVDLEQLAGSGPRGRVQAADVLERATAAPPALAEGAQVVPLAGMRRTVAERMTFSYQTTPHISLTMRVDIGALEEARARLNARAQKHQGPHVSLTALIVRAVAWALKRHPYLNSTLRGEEIHLLSEINVGVAVALENGLIVPVLRGADQRSLAETALAVNDLTVRAREGRLTPGDVAGGTFTVTNLGPFGVEQFTAIINPPQAAILAVGAAQPEALISDGQVVVRPVLRMTLSADHRIVDGALAARFLSDLRDALEEPLLLV